MKRIRLRGYVNNNKDLQEIFIDELQDLLIQICQQLTATEYIRFTDAAIGKQEKRNSEMIKITSSDKQYWAFLTIEELLMQLRDKGYEVEDREVVWAIHKPIQDKCNCKEPELNVYVPFYCDKCQREIPRIGECEHPFGVSSHELLAQERKENEILRKNKASLIKRIEQLEKKEYITQEIFEEHFKDGGEKKDECNCTWSGTASTDFARMINGVITCNKCNKPLQEKFPTPQDTQRIDKLDLSKIDKHDTVKLAEKLNELVLDRNKKEGV